MQSADVEALNAVGKELDRVIYKLKDIRENAAAEIADVATLLEELMKVLNKAEQEMSGTINTSTQVDAPSDVDDPMADEADMQVEMERKL